MLTKEELHLWPPWSQGSKMGPTMAILVVQSKWIYML
jgi:hypothetical protein